MYKVVLLSLDWRVVQYRSVLVTAQNHCQSITVTLEPAQRYARIYGQYVQASVAHWLITCAYVYGSVAYTCTVMMTRLGAVYTAPENVPTHQQLY